LLSEAGFQFTVQVRPTDETWPEHLLPHQVAEFLARQKALVWQDAELAQNLIIVAADTTVVLGQTILNKPADAAQAHAMLHALSGKSHHVITGVAIRTAAGIQSFAESTKVTLREVTRAEIEAYIATGAPLDKAGAYGIQDGFGMAAITHIQGCYYNVMGLPVARLYPYLKQLMG